MLNRCGGKRSLPFQNLQVFVDFGKGPPKCKFGRQKSLGRFIASGIFFVPEIPVIFGSFNVGKYEGTAGLWPAREPAMPRSRYSQTFWQLCARASRPKGGIPRANLQTAKLLYWRYIQIHIFNYSQILKNVRMSLWTWMCLQGTSSPHSPRPACPAPFQQKPLCGIHQGPLLKRCGVRDVF